MAPDSVGLDDEPEVGLDAEVERWVRMFETVTDDLRSGFERAAAALRDTIPEAVPSTIVHGEYRLGNLLAHGDDVAAIIDWELWSREDPQSVMVTRQSVTCQPASPSASASWTYTAICIEKASEVL